MQNTFDLVRNGQVSVRQHSTKRGNPFAEITVDDKYVHTFSPKSRVSKHLSVMSPTDLAERLSGGNFFFVENQLVDFRDGNYDGFIHTDEAIKVFMEVLGYIRSNQLQRHQQSDDVYDASNIVLRKTWNEHDIHVPGYQQGGDFSSRLSFVWNPFVRTINSSFDLVRLICTNGMIGLTSFLNARIPLENRWQEHLDIASRRIQNQVSSVVVQRVDQMRLERATVADCLLLESHAHNRFNSPGRDIEERERLLHMISAVSPSRNLADTYRPTVFLERAIASQLPAHLTNLDLFNLATELRSHSAQSKDSSNNALDRFANGLMFNPQNDAMVYASSMTAGKVAAFSDPEKAFFGVLN